MNYCGVESRRMAGVNNIELPAAADQGVRWDGDMIYDRDGSDGQRYFPITMASVLTRTGMPYASYLEMRAKYPTLELTDIFGLNRLAQTTEDEYLTLVAIVEGESHNYLKELKDNAFIEIGARVLNADFQVKLEFKHIMKRLFVTTTERLPTEKAEALQKNTAGKEVEKRYTDKGLPAPAPGTPEYLAIEDTVEMYKQMGSCFLNPMLRLGDALNYIVRLRQATETFAKKNNGAPKIFLANMGPIPQHKARADFSTSFVNVAALETIPNNGFPTIDEAVQAALDSGAKAMIICSTDDTYPDIVPELSKKVKAAKPEMMIILAGYPKEYIEAFKEAGVDEFLHIRSNALDLLAKIQKHLEVIA